MSPPSKPKHRRSLASGLAIAICLLGLAASLLPAQPAAAGGGIAITMENMFVPLGKRAEKVFDGVTQISASASGRPADLTPSNNASGLPVVTPSSGTGIVLGGRETTEWIGLSAFWDLNRNWRLLGGAHTTLINGAPLFKFDGSIAFLLPMPDTVPIQPYLYFGAVPVISTTPDVPAFGFNLNGGLGLDYLWNNSLFAQIRLNAYFLSAYSEADNKDKDLQWFPGSFSISAGMGMLF